METIWHLNTMDMGKAEPNDQVKVLPSPIQADFSTNFFLSKLTSKIKLPWDICLLERFSF